MKDKKTSMLPPLRPAHRPSRTADPDRNLVGPPLPIAPPTDAYGRLVLKSPLRVLEPQPRQAKLTVVK